MNSDHPPIRPPSEADSILLRVTKGCSYNKCTFCPAYKEIPFTIRSNEQIKSDLASLSSFNDKRSRLFLCDGDALILPQTRLTEIFDMIHTMLPAVKRIGSYANAKSISTKSDEELRELRNAGLKVIHMGLESGDDRTLERLKKWGKSSEIVKQAKRVKEAGIKIFLTVLLGAGGVSRSKEHARFTGEALSDIDPNYTGALTIIPHQGTVLHEQFVCGEFSLPTPFELLEELREMLQYTNLSKGLFFANHASNYLPLNIRLPNGKEDALKQIDAALQRRTALKPEWLRGL
ncbi:Radical SAM domain protein [Chitinispirillum alkaliphilum]|nr:Radical SAM domain protein [Chitinispirillum alkaliphilum]